MKSYPARPDGLSQSWYLGSNQNSLICFAQHNRICVPTDSLTPQHTGSALTPRLLKGGTGASGHSISDNHSKLKRGHRPEVGKQSHVSKSKHSPRPASRFPTDNGEGRGT